MALQHAILPAASRAAACARVGGRIFSSSRTAAPTSNAVIRGFASSSRTRVQLEVRRVPALSVHVRGVGGGSVVRCGSAFDRLYPPTIKRPRNTLDVVYYSHRSLTTPSLSLSPPPLR